MAATTNKCTSTEVGVGEMTLKVETTSALDMDRSDLTTLLYLVVRLRRDLNLATFRFQVKPPGSNPSLFLYTFSGFDGREWRQEIDFAFDPPRMNFTCGFWTEVEFAPHRPLRQLVIGMHGTVGLADVKCDFVPA